MSTFQLPPDLQVELAAHLQSGRYGSADEVFREAFQALKAHETEVALIQQGIDDMNAGHVRSLHEFDREFRQQNSIPRNDN